MPAEFPCRGESHQLEEASERYFKNSLPRNWTCEKPLQDYGVDLRVDIFDDGDAKGLELLVQLKASKEPTKGEKEVVSLKVSTYNYLVSKLQVVMLVKYVESVGEAYWLLLKDVSPPNKIQKTFSIHVPKTNRLSVIEWQTIQGYVQKVTYTKLSSWRKSNKTK